MRHLCALITTTLLAGSAFADTINVPGDYPTIQGAIDAASNGDTVMIAGGSYYEHEINSQGKAITIQGAVDTGGLPVTIIDAQKQGPVLYCDSSETDKTVFSNLIITGGLWFNGGGIYLTSSSPTFTNCVISGNVALEDGGGMYVSNTVSNVQLINCTFTGNTASESGYGGGLCVSAGDLSCENCTFEYNDAFWGGGAINGDYTSDIALTNCTIESNTARCHGGGIKAYSCVLTDVSFNGNALGNSCSGETVGGGALWLNSDSSQLTNCSFTGNSAPRGGGVFCWGKDTSPVMTNCTFEDNTSSDEGGGILITMGSTPVLNQCIITDNTAGTYGGGIYSTGMPMLLNCTACDNMPTQIFGQWNDNGGNTIQAICGSMEGACCIEDDCAFIEQEDCEASGGDWQGYDALCEDVSCVQPAAFGACCINGEALLLYDYDCIRVMGTFMGEGTDPNTVECPVYCPGDVTGDGQVNVEDLLTVIANWNNCP